MISDLQYLNQSP